MKPVIINCKPYLLVKSVLDHIDGSCGQCAFEHGECPKTTGNVALCIKYEREVKHQAHIIEDTAQSRANYIARVLTS